MQPINILFVCLGNICRSPMAEYVMREKIKQAHLQHKILTASAGTSGWHDGEGMHCGTADILDQHKIASNDFVSRKVRSKDWADFDWLHSFSLSKVIKKILMARIFVEGINKFPINRIHQHP